MIVLSLSVNTGVISVNLVKEEVTEVAAWLDSHTHAFNHGTSSSEVLETGLHLSLRGHILDVSANIMHIEANQMA